MLLSGGIDSAVCLTLLRDSAWEVDAIWVDYGQPAAAAERKASRAIAEYVGVGWSEAAVHGLHVPAAGEIPGRNDLLVATARTCRPARSLAIGVHAGTDYADCSPSWVDGWQRLLDTQCHGVVSLLAPLLNLEKQEILALARDQGLPLDLTHSCERGEPPCGACLSCRDRGHIARA